MSLLIPYFLITLVTEAVLLQFAVRNTGSHACTNGLLSMGINVFTWPLAIYFYNFEIAPLWIIELMVILIEGLLLYLFYKLSWKSALLASVVFNISSWFIGFCYSWW